MTNLCTRIVPTGSTVTTFGGGTYFNSDAQSARSNNASLYQSGSVLTGNNWILQIPVGGAFDAETFGITCQAFSNAAVSIPALQTSIQGLQTQMTALINGEVSRLPNPDILQAEGVIFGATVTAIAAVYGLKRIYRLLVPDVVAGHE